ncbi:hypothetical protein MSMEG_2158 [Mycolicibacterium smegmatis MC2 155]|uniref:Uncharacterized protein n=1 Tax=Mycolicibacterium smegmatis (strain ATCC 700084 / mc(2)155) TaxID=246196 RepID=A0QUC6_MYCS2|nr:hypothetical protein MSMEG_2158 [Mycolicibacterium smegmatis MC2 155]
MPVPRFCEDAEDVAGQQLWAFSVSPGLGMRVALVAADDSGRRHGPRVETFRNRTVGHQCLHECLLAAGQFIVFGHVHTSRACLVIGAAQAAAAIASSSSNNSAAGGKRPSRSSMNGVSTRSRNAVTRSRTSGGVRAAWVS